MNPIPHRSRRPDVASLLATLLALPALAAPSGPEVAVPEGGSAPGPYPNASVTAVNVIARGSNAGFDGRAEVVGFDGNGPIPWSVNRYNRGDYALRLSPADPTAAATSMGQGFIDFADNSPGLPASHAWRPTTVRGVVIPTARQNGPIDWNDGEGPFYPTVAISQASSGPGYDMLTGSFGTGNLDLITGSAGTPGSSPEANFAFSAAWFPYDQGWLAGEVGNPILFDAFLPDGTAQWRQANSRAAGLSAGLVRWRDYPSDTGIFGGLAELRLPGVNTLEDGMLFATSTDGSSDINILGVAPLEDGSAWLITLREDSATDAETLATSGQSQFQFVFIPFNAERLIGGHIVGADASKRRAAGDFTVTRTGTGTYELVIPGKTGSSGALILQAAAFEPGTTEPLATRAFLSYEYVNDRFVIQSRVTSSDTTANLTDVNFYVAWIDFAEPLAPPAGPRMRALGPVAASPPDVRVLEAGIAAHTTEPEVLVTTIDADNLGGYTDPLSGNPAVAALIGRFYDPRSLTPTSEPFVIVGNPSGAITRHDVKFNPVSRQYVVVANLRAAGLNGTHFPAFALIHPASVAGENSPVARVFAYRDDAEFNFDDVAIAISSGNGNILFVAEYAFPGEGEGVVAALFDAEGNLLTPGEHRLDLLQPIGDEDDPDAIYLPQQDAFLYFTNTDGSNGSEWPFNNRIVGAVVDANPDNQGRIVTRPEAFLSDGLPEGTPEGHPAALQSPFNGELLVAYDWGNGTANGQVAFNAIGPAPAYSFTQSRPEVPYLEGESGNPLNHQHPQLAADPERGVIVVGFNSTGSTIGLPSAYVFTLLGPDGQPLASQLGAPYFLADARGGLGTGANFHNLKFSPPSGSFVAAYTTGTPTTTYLAALQITSNHLASDTPPTLAVRRVGNDLEIAWPTTAGFQLQGTPALGIAADWTNLANPVVAEGGTNRVTVTPSAAAQYFRLIRP